MQTFEQRSAQPVDEHSAKEDYQDPGRHAYMHDEVLLETRLEGKVLAADVLEDSVTVVDVFEGVVVVVDVFEDVVPVD